MRVHVYSLCWNEARMLPYYFRHYDDVAAHYFIFDNGSTDASLDLLRRHPRTTVEHFDKKNESFVLTARDMYNNFWKQSRGQADWIIVCNVDEHLYHPAMLKYLDACTKAGATAVPAVGFQMVSDEFPTVEGRLCDTLRDGWRSKEMDKIGIFDPNQIEEINFGPGRHQVAPIGRFLVPREPAVRLLHYKFLGLEYVKTRHSELLSGLGRVDLEKRYGYQYAWDDATTRKVMDEIKSHASRIV